MCRYMRCALLVVFKSCVCIMSLPVQFGIDKAKWICVGSIDLTQIAVAAYLASVGETKYAAALAALILPQMYLQAPICKSPL